MKENLNTFLKAFPFGLGLCLFFGQTLFFTQLFIAQENKINELLLKHHNSMNLIAQKLEILEMQINKNHAALHLQINDAKHKLDLAEYKSISTISSGLYSGDNTILQILTSKPVLIVLCLVGVYYGFNYLTGIEAVNKNIKTLSTDVNTKLSNLNTNVNEQASQIKVNLSEVNSNIEVVNNQVVTLNSSVSSLGREINFSLSRSKDETIYQILRFFNYNQKPPGGGGSGGQIIESTLQIMDGSGLPLAPGMLTQSGILRKRLEDLNAPAGANMPPSGTLSLDDNVGTVLDEASKMSAADLAQIADAIL
jgi:hypothetical protein